MKIIQGDITKLAVDVIVNAANSTLLGGGGVDGAIHAAAGEELFQECMAIASTMPGGCPTGDVVITDGYKLPAQHVFHAVGPVWFGGDSQEDEKLSSCYEKSLRLAVEYGLDSIAFPAISTGAYGFPIARATRIALSQMKKFDRILEITAVCFDKYDYDVYQETYDLLREDQS